MTANLRCAFCLALALIGINSAFAQGFFIEGNSLSDRYFASDVVPGPELFATDFTITNAGTLAGYLTWGQDSGEGIQAADITFYAYVLRPDGANFEVMAETGPLVVANLGTNIFPAEAFSLQVGDLIAHLGRGIPLDTGTGGPSTCYYNGGEIPMPSVGDMLQLPSANYPLYNDGGRNYAIAVAIGGLPTIPVTNETAGLNIARSGTNVFVTWPVAETNTLLQTTDLAFGAWTPNTNFIPIDGTNILTIPSPVGNMFFRLGNP